jgi:hypothetical protein
MKDKIQLITTMQNTVHIKRHSGTWRTYRLATAPMVRLMRVASWTLIPHKIVVHLHGWTWVRLRSAA